MGEYDRQIATAKRVIAKKGAAVTWQVKTDTPDASEPWKNDTTDTVDHAVRIAFFPNTGRDREMLRLLGNTNLPVGETYGIMAAVDFEPSLKDIVLRDGKNLAPKSIDPLQVNEQLILYTIGFDAA